MALVPLYTVRAAAGYSPTAILPIPGGILANIVGRTFGGALVNTLGFLTTSPVAQQTLITIAQVVRDQLLPSLLQAMNNRSGFQNIRVHDMLRPQVRSHTLALTGTNQGVRTGKAAPSNVAEVIGTRTDRSGGSYRGRMFLAGVDDEMFVDNEINSTQMGRLGQIGLAILALNNFFTSTGPAVLSRTKGTATFIRGYQLDNLIDDKSRRLTGRGQ